MPKFNLETAPSFCPQPVFLIGTYNEDGSPNFAPISWVSVTWSTALMMVVSMHGQKATKDNIFRTGVFSANLANPALLALVDRFGCTSGKDGAMNAPGMEFERGFQLSVPVLKASKWVYECETVKTVEMGESHTFFAEIRNSQLDESLRDMDTEMVDLKRVDPVIWAACNYFAVGERLGAMGDFLSRPQA